MACSTDITAARELALRWHAGQLDKSGKPYTEHLQRVAERLSSPEAQVVAWLHDSLEDTALPPQELEARFGADTLAAVQAMTHRPGEPYELYVQRAGMNPVSRLVKISDLIDNSNLSRLAHVTLRDVERQAKYNRALLHLLSMGPID